MLYYQIEVTIWRLVKMKSFANLGINGFQGKNLKRILEEAGLEKVSWRKRFSKEGVEIRYSSWIHLAYIVDDDIGITKKRYLQPTTYVELLADNRDAAEPVFKAIKAWAEKAKEAYVLNSEFLRD